MQVKVEELSAVEKKVAVEIPWEHVRAKMNEVYRDLGRKVQLRGFRKGHVPREMLERLYGKSVERDVTRDLVRESFALAAQEHDLRPVADPIVDEVTLAPGKPFRYSARFEVRTEFEPKDYAGLALARRAAAVTDEAIDRALEARRQAQVELKPIEGRSETTDRDFLVLDVHGRVGDEELTQREITVDLTQRENEPFPGLVSSLVGLPLDTRDRAVDIDVPEASASELAGKKVRLVVTIKQAREKMVPALDDEFAKDTGEADTLADLREKTRARLLEQDTKKADRELRDQAVKEVCARNPIPVAPALVERQLDVMMHRARQELAMQGLDPRRLDEEKIRNDLRENATTEVRAALLLEAIADKEKVEVTAQDLDKRIAEIAQLRRQHPAKTKADLVKNEQLAAVRHALREEKVLDLILSKATITPSGPTGTEG